MPDSPRTFKRDNWSNDQIIEFLKGCKLTTISGELPTWIEDHNDGVDSCIDLFYDFTRPLDEMGAMGYCEEEKTIYHIGTIPPSQ